MNAQPAKRPTALSHLTVQLSIPLIWTPAPAPVLDHAMRTGQGYVPISLTDRTNGNGENSASDRQLRTLIPP